MECKVSFFGGIAEAADNTKSAKVSFTGKTLGGLLDRIKKKWPKTADYIDGPKSGAVVLVLNGISLKDRSPDRVLSKGDELSIIHLISGG